MSGRWYKRCGGDFIHGTMMLSLEEKGAYSLCLDLIYDRGGPIPDDARWLSGVCGVSLRKWATIRQRLLDLGKLVAENDLLSNSRADLELVSMEVRARERAESGAKGGRKRAEKQSDPKENSYLGQAELKRIDKNRGEGSVSNDTGAPAPPVDPLKELFDLGVSLLTASGCTEKQARSLIGKYRKAKDDAEVLQGLIDCRTKAISNPVEWLEKRFNGGQFVSASGYQYRGSLEAIKREAEKRADWATYWTVESKISGGSDGHQAAMGADPANLPGHH
jgi:uncharacterized protein YdaU (DUF1376 family)